MVEFRCYKLSTRSTNQKITMVMNYQQLSWTRRRRYSVAMQRMFMFILIDMHNKF